MRQFHGETSDFLDRPADELCRDPRMSTPGLGNDPANICGERVEGFLGLTANCMVPGVGPGSLGVEVGMPLYERANGMHLAGGWSVTLSAMLRF